MNKSNWIHFTDEIEPGHQLQAHVCRLYNDTTPSVLKKDQLVKAGSFLARQHRPHSQHQPVEFERKLEKFSALPVMTPGWVGDVATGSSHLYTHLVRYERLIIPDLHV